MWYIHIKNDVEPMIYFIDIMGKLISLERFGLFKLYISLLAVTGLPTTASES